MPDVHGFAHLENTPKLVHNHSRAHADKQCTLLSICLFRTEETVHHGKSLFSFLIVPATLAVVTLSFVSDSHAQASSYTKDQAQQATSRAEANAKRPTPRMADGHPTCPVSG